MKSLETPSPVPERVAHYRDLLENFLMKPLEENDLEGFSLNSVNAQVAAIESLSLSSTNETASLVTNLGERIAISLFTKTTKRDTFLVQTLFCQRNPNGFLEEIEPPTITLSRYGKEKLRDLERQLEFKPVK